MSEKVRRDCQFCKGSGISLAEHETTKYGSGYDRRIVPCYECGGKGYRMVDANLVQETSGDQEKTDH